MSKIAEACCTRPPVVSPDYEPAGTRTQIGVHEVYHVGPLNASKALVVIYDIFGLTQQTLLGADMLSSLLPETIILVPDLFDGAPLDKNVFALPAEERTKVVTTFMTSRAVPQPHIEAVRGLTEHAYQAGLHDVQQWGVFGLCWGGKLSAVLSGADTAFHVGGTGHPSRLDPVEAAAITIPYICLFSPEDGPSELREQYEQALRNNGQSSYVETYVDRPHGWMAARADLTDQTAKKEYERAYKKAADFFSVHL